jgi:hypothetical protein
MDQDQSRFQCSALFPVTGKLIIFLDQDKPGALFQQLFCQGPGAWSDLKEMTMDWKGVHDAFDGLGILEEMLAKRLFWGKIFNAIHDTRG